MNTMVMLVRREFWENRSLWIALAAVLVVLTAVFAFGDVHFDRGIQISVDDKAAATQVDPEKVVAEAIGPRTQKQRETAYAGGLLATLFLFAWVAATVAFFYLIDALYTERKDRSILFWKSLPVSDTQTVLSKLVVALVCLPVMVLLFTALAQLALGAIWSVRSEGSVLASAFIGWDLGIWLRVQAVSVIAAAVAVLWYAPLAGYLLVVSAWVRRNAFLWAVLPPAVLLMLDELFLKTDLVANFLSDRLFGYLDLFQRGFKAAGNSGDSAEARIAQAIEAIGSVNVLSSASLWIGLVAATLLVWVAIRIRRYRDDT